MLDYKVFQFDADGNPVNVATVKAVDCNAALRGLSTLADGCDKIVVENSDGEKSGEVKAAYWQQRIRRR